MVDMLQNQTKQQVCKDLLEFLEDAGKPDLVRLGLVWFYGISISVDHFMTNAF